MNNFRLTGNYFSQTEPKFKIQHFPLRALLIVSLILLFTSSAFSRQYPQMRPEDKARIACAMEISKLYGNRIWNGFGDVPFPIILVTDSVEYLINFSNPGDDFLFSEYDTLLQSNIYVRPTRFNKHFLATFPALNGRSCVVIGTPENTGLTSTGWIITLLHEHFHQYQTTERSYYDQVTALDLSGGDQTGMWQLNFPFPYDSAVVIERYNNYTRALSNALNSRGTDYFPQLYENFVRERELLRNILHPRDFRYFSFQLWQEGIARYTEYKLLELLDDYHPSSTAATLKDFTPFREYRKIFFRKHSFNVTGMNIDINRRECFYDIGFAEGLLLDEVSPRWRENYNRQRFILNHPIQTK